MTASTRPDSIHARRPVDRDARPIVDIRGLHKTFHQQGPWPWSPRREVLAVQGVEFTVQPGEVVALVGQSGSGKTTVSRIVLGLEEPTRGEVRLEGQPWSGVAESARRGRRVHYQYVPQDAMGALDPQQTAHEHVIETLTVLGGLSSAEARDKAGEMLDRLGLGARLHALPREMSGGEQRRVTLARVLALDPRLVVADEPTSGLDPDRRESVLEALIGNLPPDAGCILVTHDMTEARGWCHRVLAMLAGRVIEEVDLAVAEPVHPYARILFDPWSAPVPRGPLATSGCPFCPDCALAVDGLELRCRADVPSLNPFPDGGPAHRVACHALAPDPQSS
ncbi:MAG: ABC transporter ATP-binding protein [Alphaproteobacteria bacterium]|nr:ABC transporter ATP-binding protein [Alphaproteobacteria bacterium]